MPEASPVETLPTRANWHGSRAYALSLLAGAALAVGVAKPVVEPLPASAAGIGDCLPYFEDSRYRNHEYEVCTTYIFNVTKKALQGFYKFGNNRVGYVADPFRHHFETRYWGRPRQAIEHEVDSWPETNSFTGNRVTKNIDLVSLSSSLKADRGLLRTRESWRVTSPGGRVLHREPRHTRNVTMCRGKLPGHLLHEWFVVRLTRDPGFNCIAFDKNHGLDP